MPAGLLSWASAVASVSLIAIISAAADEVGDFYRGKTVQVVIPSGMGGSVALYGKLAADYIGRHIPGQPTVILVTKPGAGGLTAIDFIANVAPKDGTAIAEVLPPSLLVPLLREVRYDSIKIEWLGSLTARPGILGVWHTAPATTIEGAKKVELMMGSSGVGSGNYQLPTLANAVLGTRFKLVTGYPGGGEINLAIERGEIHGRSNYWSGWTTVKPDWIRDKKLIFMFRTGPPAADMPDVPAFADLVTGEERQMVRVVEAPDDIGVGFFTAPGIPAERLAALRKAFWDMMHDDAFLAAANKLDAPIAPVPPATVHRVVADLYATPPAVLARLKKIITPSQ
jgi:tripartite-type tricarboxylate transporter receptor subunit TctC